MAQPPRPRSAIRELQLPGGAAGAVRQWLVAVGDSVVRGQVLAYCRGARPLRAIADGTVVRLLVQPEERVPAMYASPRDRRGGRCHWQ